MSLKKVNDNYYIHTSNGCMHLGSSPTLNPPSPTGFDWESHYMDIDQKKKREHNGRGPVNTYALNSRNVKIYTNEVSKC